MLSFTGDGHKNVVLTFPFVGIGCPPVGGIGVWAGQGDNAADEFPIVQVGTAVSSQAPVGLFRIGRDEVIALGFSVDEDERVAKFHVGSFDGWLPRMLGLAGVDGLNSCQGEVQQQDLNNKKEFHAHEYLWFAKIVFYCQTRSRESAILHFFSSCRASEHKNA